MNMLLDGKTNFLKHTVTSMAMKSWNLVPLSLIRITRKIDFKRQVKAHLGILIGG